MLSFHLAQQEHDEREGDGDLGRVHRGEVLALLPRSYPDWTMEDLATSRARSNLTAPSAAATGRSSGNGAAHSFAQLRPDQMFIWRRPQELPLTLLQPRLPFVSSPSSSSSSASSTRPQPSPPFPLPLLSTLSHPPSVAVAAAAAAAAAISNSLSLSSYRRRRAERYFDLLDPRAAIRSLPTTASLPISVGRPTAGRRPPLLLPPSALRHLSPLTTEDPALGPGAGRRPLPFAASAVAAAATAAAELAVRNRAHASASRRSSSRGEPDEASVRSSWHVCHRGARECLGEGMGDQKEAAETRTLNEASASSSNDGYGVGDNDGDEEGDAVWERNFESLIAERRKRRPDHSQSRCCDVIAPARKSTETMTAASATTHHHHHHRRRRSSQSLSPSCTHPAVGDCRTIATVPQGLSRLMTEQHRQHGFLKRGDPSALRTNQLKKKIGADVRLWTTATNTTPVPLPATSTTTTTAPSTAMMAINSTAYDDLWNRRFDELRKYCSTHGDCLVPQKWPKNLQLGTWVNTQRRHYKMFMEGKPSSMRWERIEALESIGFAWSTSRGAPSKKRREAERQQQEAIATRLVEDGTQSR